MTGSGSSKARFLGALVAAALLLSGCVGMLAKQPEAPAIKGGRLGEQVPANQTAPVAGEPASASKQPTPTTTQPLPASTQPSPSASLALIEARHAPEKLPGASYLFGWTIPDGWQVLAVVDRTLVVQKESAGEVAVRGIEWSGLTAWERRFTKPHESARLSWDVSYSGRRIALHVAGSDVVVMDEVGLVSTVPDYRDKDDVVPQFVHHDSMLLLTFYHGKSRVSPRVLEWFDLSTPTAVSQRVELAYTAIAAALQPYVVAESGRMFTIYSGNQTAEVDVTDGEVVTNHGLYELEGVTVNGEYLLAVDSDDARLFDKRGQMRWRQKGEGRSEYKLASHSGDVWRLIRQSPAAGQAELFRYSAGAMVLAALKVDAGAGARLVAVHPDGDAVILRLGEQDCLVTARSQLLACHPFMRFRKNGKEVLVVRGSEAERYQWPLVYQ